MKAFTDVEESKKLAEILPSESVDMCYRIVAYNPNNTHVYQPYCFVKTLESDIPCWSLAALLEQFEDTAGLAKEYGLWFCYDNRKSSCTKHYDNPVDACVEMIVKLKERNLL